MSQSFDTEGGLPLVLRPDGGEPDPIAKWWASLSGIDLESEELGTKFMHLGFPRCNELILPIGGTMLSLDSEKGRAPGAFVETLLRTPGSVVYNGMLTEEVPVVNIPPEGSRLYFGAAVDSGNLQPEDFIKIAELCHYAMKFNLCERIIIPIGTDTMAYAAAALACVLKNSSIPIVFVGSMRGVDEDESDAVEHLQKARGLAGRLDPGIYVAFGDKAHDPCRISKVDSVGLDAFKSLGANHIARIHVEPGWDPHVVSFYPTPDDFYRYFWAIKPSDSDPSKTKAEIIWGNVQKKIGAFDFTGNRIESMSEAQLYDFIYCRGDSKFGAIARAGLMPTLEQFLFPAAPTLHTKFDNRVVYEEVTPGYNFAWLEAQIEEGGSRAVLLGGISKLSGEDIKNLEGIIKRRRKEAAIVLLENPENRESPEIQRAIKRLIRAGAWESYGRTKEFASFGLKHVLGEGGTLNKAKRLWTKIEPSQGPRAIVDRPEFSGEPPSPFPSTKNGIRYISIIPGEEPSRLIREIERPEVKALIIAGFGPGNVPFMGERGLVQFIEEYSNIKPIILITQVRRDGVESETRPDIYETGRLALGAGAIQTGVHRSLEETFEILDGGLNTTSDPSALADMLRD